MSTTIYESPEGGRKTLPHQGDFEIDITSSTVWFFEHRESDRLETVTVPLRELPAIHRAIGDYLRECPQ